MREWSYQPGGRLASVVDRAAGGGTIGRHTDFTHDALGRVLTERVYLGSGTSNLELSFTNTWNPDSTRAARGFDGSAASPAQGSDVWTFTYDAMGRPDLVTQGSTTVTDYAWNADDTLASRTDLGAGSATFTYDWADRQVGIGAPTLFGSGSVGFDYRLDGLLDQRVTPNGVTAAVGYDAAKRPVQIDLGADSLTRGYDRDGNVTSDGRSLGGVSGDAGSGTATFTYDGLNRVTASSGLSRSDSYSYDRNGNRVSATEGAVTTTYAYDRADQLIGQSISGGAATAFAYSPYGDMTTAADADGAQTTHAYDAGSRMTSLTPSGATAATYTYDALGRPASRTVGSASLTYRYVGVGRVTYATVPGSGSATYALIDAAGSRIAVDTGGVSAWSAFDAHGNFAAATAEASTAIVNAVRYDAWGATLDDWSAGSGSTQTPWRFQGRLDVSPDADEPLYDYGARLYRPSGATFTQLDTYAGSAQNPLSMNRFLYAHANPTTLIDPTGHAAQSAIMIDGQCGGPTSCGTLKPQVNVGPTVTPEYTLNGSKSGNSGYTYSSNGGKKSPQTPKPFNVYLPNPSNLPWVGTPESANRLDRLERVLAASEAARQIDAAIPPEVLAYGLAIFGGASLGILLVRAGHAAATMGLGNACAIYCDDVAVAAEGIAGAPPRLPTSSRPAGGDVIDPSHVRFTQDRAHIRMGNQQLVDDLSAQLRADPAYAGAVRPVRLFEHDGIIYSLDNRRLSAFQEAGVPMPYRWATEPELARELPGKFDTTTGGTILNFTWLGHRPPQ